MVITDPHQADNPIVFANDAFCRSTGYSRDEIIGRNCRFLQGADTNRDDVARVAEAIRRREPIEQELLNYTKSGEAFWNRLLVSPVFDDAGELTYFFASQYNVTVERYASESLREKTSEFAALAENVSQLAWMAEPDGSIYWYNRRWYEYTGTDLEAMKGWGWRHVHRPDRVDAIIADVAARWKAGKSFEDVYWLRSAEGEFRPFLTRVEPIRDERGKLLRWFGTNTDISRQVDAERSLRDLNDTLEQRVAQAGRERSVIDEQLRQSQKMEAVGQLTGGVAHDFNNLLTIIRGSVDLLRRPTLTEERRQRYLEAIADTADRATKLTGQLLAFARRQALKPEVFDVGANLRAVREMIATLAGSRITVDLRLPEQPCFIDADPSQFDTTVVNMAVNGRDAMNGEGCLEIVVGTARQMPSVRSHLPVDGDFVTVAIHDTGHGIPAEDMARIFEPFFTTKGVGQGTGLGLSQVFGFAKQSGGEVLVESEVGRGTTFTLYLPAANTPERHCGDSGRQEDEDVCDGTCVLVVEDNADVGQFATATLAELGYSTVYAENADAALAELEKDANRFDVVFSDVIMPGMSGLDMAKIIRARHPRLPVVLTSGYSHVLAEQGSDGFELLHKPYSMDQVQRVLRKATRSRA